MSNASTNTDSSNTEDGCSSNFLPSGLPLRGLPTHATQVDPDSATGDDDKGPSLVYRAFSIGGSSAALLRTAATIESIKDRDVMVESSSDPLTKLTQCLQAQKLAPPPPPIPEVHINYVDIERPLSFTHVFLQLSDSEVLAAVDSFLSTSGVSTEKRHPQSNLYRCHTIVNCSILRFDIRLVPDQACQGVNVEFKRTMGTTESFSSLYKQFKASVCIDGSGSTPRSSSPISPASTLSVDDEHDDVDVAEIARAINAMALWIERDPMEALQCVGQFYIAGNTHVIQSEAILNAICTVIATYQNLPGEYSVITSTVAISCLRQFLSSVREVHSCNDISIDHVAMIALGVAKAALSDDVMARKEAVGLLVELNPRFGTDIKSRVAHVHGFSMV